MQVEIHRMMIIIASVVLVLAMILYYMRPGDDILVTIIATCLGFLFGKASNGIGKGNGGGHGNGNNENGKRD